MGGLDLKHALKPIGTLAAVITLIQGLLWVILCILAILVYHNKITLPTYENTDWFLVQFVGLYFSGGVSIEGVSTAEQVFIWMCVYLGFSIIWTVTCIIWLVDLCREDRPPVSMFLWCGTTAVILVLDLTATIWFGTDLASMSTHVNSLNILLASSSVGLLLSPALMMTMASRGFVLYLVNAGFLGVVATLAVQTLRQKPTGRAATHNTAYANPGVNPAWPERDFSDTWETRSHNRETPRFPSYVNPPMSPTYDDMPPRAQPPFLLQDPPKPRALPREPAPKYSIPEPDYSPVMTRHQPMLPLRPALKKTSPHIGRTVF